MPRKLSPRDYNDALKGAILAFVLFAIVWDLLNAVI